MLQFPVHVKVRRKSRSTAGGHGSRARSAWMLVGQGAGSCGSRQPRLPQEASPALGSDRGPRCTKPPWTEETPHAPSVQKCCAASPAPGAGREPGRITLALWEAALLCCRYTDFLQKLNRATVCATVIDCLLFLAVCSSYTRSCYSHRMSFE